MIVLNLSDKTINRLKELRKRLSPIPDNRTMIPVHDIIIDGYNAYQKDPSLFADQIVYHRRNEPTDISEMKYRREMFSKDGWDIFHVFRTLTGLSDDGAISILMDCIGYERGLLTHEYFRSFSKSDIMIEINDRTKVIEQKIDQLRKIK